MVQRWAGGGPGAANKMVGVIVDIGGDLEATCVGGLMRDLMRENRAHVLCLFDDDDGQAGCRAELCECAAMSLGVNGCCQYVGSTDWAQCCGRKRRMLRRNGCCRCVRIIRCAGLQRSRGGGRRRPGLGAGLGARTFRITPATGNVAVCNMRSRQ